MENILIQFNSDTQGIDVAEQALQELSKVDKTLADQFTKTNQQVKEREKLVDGMSSGLGDLVAKLKNAEKAAAGTFGDKVIKDFRKNLTDTTSVTKLLFTAIGAGSEKLKTLNKESAEFKKLNQEVEEGIRLFGLLSGITEEVETKTTSFKSELRAIKNELALMEDAGQDFSDTYGMSFEELAIKAAKLEDQIGDTAERVRVLSSDTANMDAAVEGVQMVANGFQIASGAAALFGQSEEDVQKVLVKLNAIMAITQGLQQMQNFLRGQSILKLKLEAAGNYILATSTTVTAATYRLFGVAVNQTSFAFKALRTAIISTGIGALIVGLTFLISKIVEWTDSTEDAEAAQNQLNLSLEAQNQLLQDNLDGIDFAKRAAIARATIAGKSAADIKKIEEQASKESIDALYDDMVAKGRIADQVRDNNAASKEAIDQANKAHVEATKKWGDAVAENELKGLEKKAELIDKDRKDQEEKNKRAGEKAIELAKRNAEALFQIEQRRLQREADIFKSLADDEGTGYDARLLALNDFVKRQSVLLEFQRKTELSKTGLTKLEIKNINSKYDLELQQLTEQAYTTRNGIIKQKDAELINDQKKFYDDQKKSQEERVALIIANVDKTYSTFNKNLIQNLTNDLELIKSLYIAGNLTIEQFEQQSNETRKKYASYDLNNQISNLEAKISNLKTTGANVEDLEIRLNELRKQKYDEDYQAFVDAEKNKSNVAIDEAQKREQAIATIKQNALQIVQNIATLIQQSDDAKDQAEIERIEKLKDRKVINEEAAQRKITAIKRKAAIQEKNMALFSAILSKSQAVAAILAEPIPFPVKPFLIASAIGLALTEIALIAARPLPQLWRGTKSAKKGLYRVGEVGMESMWHQSTGLQPLGQRGEEIKYIPEGARVFNAAETSQMMKSPAPFFELPTMAEMPEFDYSNNTTPEIDYDKLGESVAKHVGKLQDMPGFEMKLDSDGFAYYVKEKNHTTKIVNQKYSFRK